MAKLLRDVEGFKFLSRDFVVAVQEAIYLDTPFYFSSLEFSGAANLLFDALDQARVTLENKNSSTENRRLELAVIWRIEQEEGLPALVQANRNYEVDFSGVFSAIEAEVNDIVFDGSTALTVDPIPTIEMLMVRSPSIDLLKIREMLTCG